MSEIRGVASSGKTSFRDVWLDNYPEPFLVAPGCEDSLPKLIEVVRKNNGDVLSRVWSGVETRVTLECAENHVWHVKAAPVIYQDSWCAECAFDGQWGGHEPARPRRSYKDVLELAKKSGVRILDEDVNNLRAVGKWRCSKGHKWSEPARAILIRGFFCQRCEGRPAQILRRAQLVAEKRGGRCLSTEYVNNREPMKWRCAMWHEWEAPWKNVGTNGSWCMKCANKARRKQRPKRKD